MDRYKTLLAVSLSALCCSLIVAQTTKVSDPRSNAAAYVQEGFGACTLAIGKDRTKYFQPSVTCHSGIDSIALIPQEDGTWGLLLTAGEESERSEEEKRTLRLSVTIKVDDHAAHVLSMIRFRDATFRDSPLAWMSLEFVEIVRLLDELRRAESMTVSRNDEVIEFDLDRTNQAFVELVFEQLVGLTKVEKTDT